MNRLVIAASLIMMVSISFAGTTLTDKNTLSTLGSSFKIQQPMQPNKNDLIVGYAGEDVSSHTPTDISPVLA